MAYYLAFDGNTEYCESSSTVVRNLDNHKFTITGRYKATGYVFGCWNNRGVEIRSDGGIKTYFGSSAQGNFVFTGHSSWTDEDEFILEIECTDNGANYDVNCWLTVNGGTRTASSDNPRTFSSLGSNQKMRLGCRGNSTTTNAAVQINEVFYEDLDDSGNNQKWEADASTHGNSSGLTLEETIAANDATGTFVDDDDWIEVSSGISGTATITQAANTASATGELDIDGGVTATQGADTTSATGELDIGGAATASQAADTITATGALQAQAEGTLAATQGGDTAAATGELDIGGGVTATQDAQTLSATGELDIEGAATATQGADTVDSDGAGVAVTVGTATMTQGAQTVSSTGALDVSAVTTATQDANTVAATGTASLTGGVTATQGSDTTTATGELDIEGAATATQGADTVSATAGLVTVGVVSISQGGDTIESAGSDLSVIDPSPERTIVVQGEQRIQVVAQETRVIAA